MEIDRTCRSSTPLPSKSLVPACSILSNALQPHGLQPTSPLCSLQEHWSGLLFLPPVDLPNSGIKPVSPALAGRFFTMERVWEGRGYHGACVGREGGNLFSSFHNHLLSTDLMPGMLLSLRTQKMNKIKFFLPGI